MPFVLGRAAFGIDLLFEPKDSFQQVEILRKFSDMKPKLKVAVVCLQLKALACLCLPLS